MLVLKPVVDEANDTNTVKSLSQKLREGSSPVLDIVAHFVRTHIGLIKATDEPLEDIDG